MAPHSYTESSRDMAVASMGDFALTLLGPDTPCTSYLAGEWVEPGMRWRVVVCVVGGPLRTDMGDALRGGSAECSSCSWARWWRAEASSSTRADDISSAALARAFAAARPSSAPLDARLQIGRGGERWADTSQDAAFEGRPLRQGVEESMAAAHLEVREHFTAEASRLRGMGDVRRADFFDGCASRVEPAPLSEFPAGLVGEVLSDSELEELMRRPFCRRTTINATAPPTYSPRPTAFPSDLPKPTCHASFLLDEVMGSAHEWQCSADGWHQQRMAGESATRPKGLAWGLDAAKPEWRAFFASGGVVVFDEVTGEPSCLTLENYSLHHHLNGDFALREFADLPDREIAMSFGDGVSIKAQGLPLLQLACNLEALYEADGAEGVRCIADELRKFGTYDGTGWYLRAPSPSREHGRLGTATLPACMCPIGAVPKKDGSARIVNDLGFGYGKLNLSTVSVAPLPPDGLWDGSSKHAPPGARPSESSNTHGGGGAVAMPPYCRRGHPSPPSKQCCAGSLKTRFASMRA